MNTKQYTTQNARAAERLTVLHYKNRKQGSQLKRNTDKNRHRPRRKEGKKGSQPRRMETRNKIRAGQEHLKEEIKPRLLPSSPG
jgi:hypothetical protein